MIGRPLPRSLDPLPDESLPGFVLRLAHRLDRTPARISELTGLTDPGQLKPNLGRRVHLDPATRDRFAAATRLHPDEVAALCVAGLADRNAPLNARFLGRTRQPDSLAADNWVFGRSARYCPTCLVGDGSAIQTLHGGAWLRRWHLPIVFACTTHQQLLVRRCPACDLPVHHAAKQPVPNPAVPDLHPAQCRNLVAGQPTDRPAFQGAGPVCGNRLDHASIPAALDEPDLSTVLHLQQRILALLDPAQPTTVTCFGATATLAEHYADLRLLASLTWPTAAALLPQPVLRDAFDAHAAERQHTLDAARSAGKTPRSHAVWDQPPTNSLASAALFTLLENLNTSRAGDTLATLLHHPAANAWSRHYLTAEPHCSPGLRAAIADPIAAHRPRPPRTPAPPRIPAPPRPRTPPPPHSHRLPAPPPNPKSAKRTPTPRIRTPRPTPPPRPKPIPRAPRPKAARPVSPPRPRYRFGPQHIPAFLTDTWCTDHLSHLPGIDARMLRRYAACTLAQAAGDLSSRQAAGLLGLSPDSIAHPRHAVKTWRSVDPAHAHALDTALDALIDTLQTSDLIDYQHRRQIMATWTISTDLWHTITTQVRATETSTQRAHSNWSQHKRNIANAFAWIEITQGEHRFAPQRHAPGIKRGTTADPGLAIDRAWWRLRNGKPGQHYWDLRAALNPHLHDLATTIDERRTSAN